MDERSEAKVRKGRRLSPSMLAALVVSVFALTVAVSSSATASFMVGSGQIKKNAVKAKHIKKGAVGARHIKQSTITGAMLRDRSIDAAKLSPAAVAALKGGQGPKGDQGPRGLQGLQGGKGDTGSAGAPGTNGVSGYQIVNGEAESITAGAAKTFTVSCPVGKKAISGGAFIYSGPYTAPVIYQSTPSGGGASWSTSVYNASSTSSVAMEPTAVCVTAN